MVGFASLNPPYKGANRRGGRLAKNVIVFRLLNDALVRLGSSWKQMAEQPANC